MKADEDLWPDREDAFQTDDEENRAEMSFNDIGDDSDSDHTPPSRNLTELSNPPWPRSFRQSMNLLSPPAFNFSRMCSFKESEKCPSKREIENGDTESSLNKPLLSEGSINIQEFPASTIPSVADIVIQRESSLCVSLAPQQQSSFSQAVLNGINVLFGLGLLTTPYAIKEVLKFKVTQSTVFPRPFQPSRLSRPSAAKQSTVIF